MRRTAFLLLLLLVVPAVADGKDPAPKPKPLTTEQAADKVLAAVKAKDQTALRALAEQDRPDAWFVAEELLARGEADAASAFARAAPGKDVEALPGYLAAMSGQTPDGNLRETIKAARELAKAGKIPAALERAGSPRDDLVDMPSIHHAVVIARLLLQQGHERESATLSLRAGEAALALGWLVGARSNYLWAAQALERRHPRKALAAFERMLEVEFRRGRKGTVGNLRLRIGMISSQLGQNEGRAEDLEKSVASYRKARAVFEELGDELLAARALGASAIPLVASRDFTGALDNLRAALATFERLDAKADATQTLTLMGAAQRRLHRYREARRSLRRALGLAQSERALAGKYGVLEPLGSVELALGNYEAALEIGRRRLAFAEKSRKPVGVAGGLILIGLAQRHMGRYAQAITNLQRALAAAEAAKAEHHVRASLNNIGMLHTELGDDEAALVVLRRALALARKQGKGDSEAIILHNIGIALQNLDRLDEALRVFHESLALRRSINDKEGIMYSINVIGTAHLDRAEHAQALKYFGDSLQIAESIEHADGILGALGKIALTQRVLGRYESALATCERVLVAVQDTPNRDAHARALWTIAECKTALRKYDEAVDRSRQAAELAASIPEGLAETEFARAWDRFAGIYETGIFSSLLAERPADLVWFLEHGRAAALRESLGSRDTLEAAVVPPALRQELKEAQTGARAALADLRKVRARADFKAARKARRTWEATQARVELIGQRIEREAKRAAAITQVAIEDEQRIRDRLRPGEALVYYALNRDLSASAVAAVIFPERTRVVQLESCRKVQEAMEGALDGPLHVEPAALPALRKLLVEPLALPQELKRVYVSPMGRLGYVPFSLLFADREVCYMPSGTTHGFLVEDATERGQRVLAFGDPDYNSKAHETAMKLRAGAPTNLRRLPATRAEVEAVGDVRYLHKQATEDRLQHAIRQEERWRAVHLACHGLVDPQRPMLSALALTADEENDGFLTALEIFRMKIPADLVVMSACETGKGALYQTEGILGLTRAFMFAGAPRVICSLWKVDDEATQALMIRFYELWNPKEGNGIGCAAALKKAQAYVRGHDKWKHPYYWAAWVLWGLPD